MRASNMKLRTTTEGCADLQLVQLNGAGLHC